MIQKSICQNCYNLHTGGTIVKTNESTENLFCEMKQLSMNNLNVKSCNQFKITEAARQQQIFIKSKISQVS
jgi:hypothetical protein